MDILTRIQSDFKPTNPKVYDDAELKKLSCSHLEQDTFILQNGTKEKRCKACKKWDSE